jgi:hypothetical protein
MLIRSLGLKLMIKNIHFALIFSILYIDSTPLLAQSSRSLTGLWVDCRYRKSMTIRIFSGNGSYTVDSAYTEDKCKLTGLGVVRVGRGGYRIDGQGRVIATECYQNSNGDCFTYVCQPPSGNRMKCQSLGNQEIWEKIRD